MAAKPKADQPTPMGSDGVTEAVATMPPGEPVTTLVSAPPMLKTVVSVKATIPTMNYGNLEIFVSQDYFTDQGEPDAVRAMFVRSTMNTLRLSIADMIVPLADAEVERAMPALVKESRPDVWMQQKNPLYRWLRAAAPSVEIPAMKTLLNKRLGQTGE